MITKITKLFLSSCRFPLNFALRILHFAFCTRLSAAFLIFNCVFIFISTNANADQGLYISRTEYSPSTAQVTTTTNITQNGGVLLYSHPAESTKTYAFWIKRDIQRDSDTTDEDDNRPPSDGTLLSFNVDDTNVKLNVKLSDLGINDSQWHYVLYHVVGSNDPGVEGSIKIYLDGNNESVFDRNFDGIQTLRNIYQFYIGASKVGSALKSSTDFNFIIDDFTVWNGSSENVSEELLEQFSEVYNFGPSKIDRNNPNFESTTDFEGSTTLNFRIDNAFTNAPTDISSAQLNHSENEGTFVSLGENETKHKSILVRVESEYGGDKVSPTVKVGGTILPRDENENDFIEFSAPAFIYLDSSQNELGSSDDDISTFIDNAYYRARNSGYVINGVRTDTGGTSPRYFTQPKTEDLTVTWTWELEYAVIIESATGDGGFGNPDPEIGRHWISANADNTDFNAAIGSVVESEDDNGGFRFSTQGYELYDKDGNSIGLNPYSRDPVTSGDRVAIDPITITKPVRIKWLWEGKVRYRFGALGGESNAQFDGQSFIQIGNDDLQYNSGSSTDVWVPTGSQVKVGSFYRTTDRCFTLTNFPAPLGGDLNSLGADVSAFNDDTIEGRVARTYTVDVAANPTEIRWFYQPTVFRAELPLGTGLAATAPNVSLVPDLCDGAELSDLGPSLDFLLPVGDSPNGNAAGNPLRWDEVGQILYPVHPGSNRIQWRDKNNSEVYTIEIVSGYPGDTVDLASERENEDGSRQGTAPEYVLSTTLSGVQTGDFPAAPSAHYNHLFDSEDSSRNPPTILDPSASDEWAFQELTYSDSGMSASVDPNSQAFNVSNEGRSVLLYSFRPNSDEVADGNLSQERLAVRVVDSIEITEIEDESTEKIEKTLIGPEDDQLVLGRHGLLLGGGSDAAEGAVGVIFTGGDAGAPQPIDFGLASNGGSFVIDFWLNAKGLSTDSEPVAVLNMGDGALSVTLDNNLSEATVELESAVQDVEIPFAFTGAVDLQVTNTTTGATLESGVDYTVPVGGTNGASTGSISLVETIVSESVSTDLTIGLLPAFVGASSLEVTNATNDNILESGTDFTIDGENNLLTIISTETTEALDQAFKQITTPFAFTDENDLRVTDADTGVELTFNVDYTVSPPTLVNMQNTTEGGSVRIENLNALVNAGDTLTIERPNAAVAVGDNLRINLLNVSGAASTMIVDYFGMQITQPFSRSGPGWRHYVINVFEDSFGPNVSATILHLYVDGVREETGAVTATLPVSSTTATVATTLATNGITFGVGADTDDGLLLDQFRLFVPSKAAVQGELTSADLVALRSDSDAMAQSLAPELKFNFARYSDAGVADDPNGTELVSFNSTGSRSDVAVGPYVDDLRVRVDLQEVATRLDSTLDRADFNGSGYILTPLSNYNASIYSRSADVGTWGPLFPVNSGNSGSGYYDNTDGKSRLEVAYYENLFLTNPELHPNVAWPYVATYYDEVTYPLLGENKDKAIYIASRIGSEGVDQNGYPQEVFDLARYENLTIYNQPNKNQPGFNPNEEHALVAPSGRAALKVKNLGESIANNPPLAAFALQNKVDDAISDYTSDPWVLVQVNNLLTGEPEMAAYQVFDTRGLDENGELEDDAIPFPRPTDSAISDPDDGLAYESAENPEDRFLTIDSDLAHDFAYTFDYPVAAGDLLIPPYPLNIVIGNVTMPDARGGNIFEETATPQGIINKFFQRTLWRDVNGNAWVVSGDGKFFHQYFYPFRNDFYLPGAVSGDPVAWLPEEETISESGDFIGDGAQGSPLYDAPNPQKVVYSSFWRSDYPKLKRGETLTYQGGEYFNENPGSNGLPSLVAMSAAEIVYDSATPSMVLIKNPNNSFEESALDDVADASARIIRPLDRREASFTVNEMASAGFSPADESIFTVAERWYFNDLPGSLQGRFYYDSLAEKLIFRGYLNGKNSGSSDLTAGPDPVNILEPNVLTKGEYESIYDLSDDADWTTAVGKVFLAVQNPHGVDSGNNDASATINNLQGLRNPPDDYSPELLNFWSEDLKDKNNFANFFKDQEDVFAHLDSFGVGSALVPNADLLLKDTGKTFYVTIVENNRSELDGAPVSLHIIEIIPDRYRGALVVAEAENAFSEKISIQHNGEFGANTGDLYYEWWIRDAAALDVVAQEILADGSLKETDEQGNTLWQQYIPEDADSNLGLHSIVFEGRPDVVLADKLIVMRYRHKKESNWNLVPFEVANPADAWKSVDPAPFQWVGAANSPQLQADGSRRYIPQLVMGWVKRILDRINPYEARYTDFFNTESPAAYSSQIQIAGPPFAGKVALNPDKDVIENTGLIELYETVLARARELSIDNSSNAFATDGINQALLLAATRLSVLYELLGSEAYSDAQDTTITVTDDGGLSDVVSFTHAFQNLEADLMHEELALLRGTDFLKSYPVYNRMFWNYTKGLGEAAYNINYNIYDENLNGFINEDDARTLYPQGHGDAWGHYLSAVNMTYTLLQHPVFSWKTRSELYSLMQNVLEVDYLDEKTFTKLAAAKARAGREIVRGTYRLNYTQDPDGQWQGYTDGADPARAWGVSEWAHRAGQGAYFDWAVANALLPENAEAATPVENPENLDRIDRYGALFEIAEITGSLYEIQAAMDEANGGVNPLGFDSGALSFDLNLESYENASGADRRSHFEQIYSRALVAAGNAKATLDFAAQAENKLRRIGDNTIDLINEAFVQDLDYKNRLIEIFGMPYDGTIGFGKTYPEGYDGPDILLFSYLDYNTVESIIPAKADVVTSVDDTEGDSPEKALDFEEIKVQTDYTRSALESNSLASDIYDKISTSVDDVSVQLGEIIDVFVEDKSYIDFSSDLERQSIGDDPDDTDYVRVLPVRRAAAYAFTSPPDGSWGQRTSYGRLQQILEEMLLTEIELEEKVEEYQALLKHYHTLTLNLQHEITQALVQEEISDDIQETQIATNAITTVLSIAADLSDLTSVSIKDASEAVAEAFPDSVGFSPDIFGPVTGAILLAGNLTGSGFETAKTISEQAIKAADFIRDVLVDDFGRDLARVDIIDGIENSLGDIARFGAEEAPIRTEIGALIQELEIKRQEYVTTVSEGTGLLIDREGFNTGLAAAVQSNRYQDMIFRLSRNEVMGKYQSAFNHAARYAWMAAQAYDYESSLDPGDPAAPGDSLDRIIRERQLGLWVDGEPQVGQGGLAEILAELKGNFQVLVGQLGIDNPQPLFEKMSLRSELFRIGSPESAGGTAANDDLWKDALKARIVPDLTRMPEFVRHCRPFSTPEEGPQPGIVIRFRSTIENGLNFFGNPLEAGDHTYSTANFATKIRGFGVWLDNYNAAGLAATPRAYLVPVGNDYLRTSSSPEPMVRVWDIQEQRIPTPFVINESDISAPGFIPTLNGVDGGFAELRRHGDYRMYHNYGDDSIDDSELILDSRLISRSVWNSEWLLIIPGAHLHVDPMTGLMQFAEEVEDIKLNFSTYSHHGQ